MRTTLDIDDDVLAVYREVAASQKKSLGKVISERLRRSELPTENCEVRNGIHLLPVRPGATLVTNEMINKLRDELGV